jgi:3-oxoacyl-(acyl-carrier-protein) synthase
VIAYVAGAGRWRSPRLQPADGAVAAWAAETLDGIGSRAEALCVATLDSGARESVHFWRASRANGLSFANPRPFPWTLANSPAGRIAQSLDVRGPTFTIVGRADALTAALDQALEELASGRARQVLVAALDGITLEETRLAAVSLVHGDGAEDGTTVAAGSQPTQAAIVAHDTASATLAAVIDRLEAGESAAVGSERDGWIEFNPDR